MPKNIADFKKNFLAPRDMFLTRASLFAWLISFSRAQCSDSAQDALASCLSAMAIDADYLQCFYSDESLCDVSTNPQNCDSYCSTGSNAADNNTGACYAMVGAILDCFEVDACLALDATGWSFSEDGYDTSCATIKDLVADYNTTAINIAGCDPSTIARNPIVDWDSSCDLNECEGVECGNGGTCNDPAYPITDYTCSCLDGYQDVNGACVDIDGCVEEDVCGEGGTCSDIAAPGTGYTCACSLGYELNSDDSACIDVDACEGSPCGQGGTCTDFAAPGTGYTCNCTAGYELTSDDLACQDIDSCDGTDCGLGGSCVDFSPPDVGYNCSCSTGTQLNSNGVCEDIDSCLDSPCGDGGVCTDSLAPGTGYTCECDDGYELTSDESTCVDIDACLSIDCGPGGNCNDVPAPGTGYSCTCDTGYELNDDLCSDVNGCLSEPCGEGGTCADVPAPGGFLGYSCSCAEGYELNSINSACQDIDGCLASDAVCGTWGNCTDIWAGNASITGVEWVCECAIGFEYNGTLCAQMQLSSAEDMWPGRTVLLMTLTAYFLA